MTLTNADKAHLNRAISIAANSTCRHRHGAVIAKGRRILSVGINVFRSHPNVVSNPKIDSTFHAEVSAIRSLRDISSGLTLYVARLGVRGNPMMSKPCMHCQEAVFNSGISKIVYSENIGYGILLR